MQLCLGAWAALQCTLMSPAASLRPERQLLGSWHSTASPARMLHGCIVQWPACALSGWCNSRPDWWRCRF